MSIGVCLQECSSSKQTRITQHWLDAREKNERGKKPLTHKNTVVQRTDGSRVNSSKKSVVVHDDFEDQRIIMIETIIKWPYHVQPSQAAQTNKTESHLTVKIGSGSLKFPAKGKTVMRRTVDIGFGFKIQSAFVCSKTTTWAYAMTITFLPSTYMQRTNKSKIQQ